MTKKIVKQLWMILFAMTLFCIPVTAVNAAQMEDTEDAESIAAEQSPLTFEIANFTYEILPDASQEDMPKGFTLGDWEYHGIAVKAGFTDRSDMVCVMGADQETGYQYRFIYDPAHELFVPYFGADIKDGYVYTVPIYEGAEIPYGFVESYFVIQTVPMFTYMREDAELTQEEIAVGSLSEDNYLVFLMMNETGEEIYYTYDLVDRTFQRALLQRTDAEKIAELNQTIDKLAEDIGALNATNTERMNKRLTIIGILVAAVLVMAGVIVNLMLKVSRLKKGEDEYWEEEPMDEEEEADEPEEVPVKKVSKPQKTEASVREPEACDDIEILDLDEED